MKFYSILIAIAMVALCGNVYAGDEGTPMPPAAKDKATVTKAVYVCPTCEMTALKPGKCKCGADLVKMHLLGTKDGKAQLCACGADCKCDAKGAKDGKCACGKEVKESSIKGLYHCKMGCPVLSDQPAKCACGMDMEKVE